MCVDVASSGSRGRGIAHMVVDFALKGMFLGLCRLGGELVHRGDGPSKWPCTIAQTGNVKYIYIYISNITDV